MIVNKILIKFEPEKNNLLTAIKEIAESKGFFSVEDAEKTATYFKMSVSEVFSTASFYDEIKTKKPANVVVRFCDSPNCQSKNIEKIIKEIEILYHQKAGEENNKNLKIERMSCAGRCLDGPIMIVNENIYEKIDVGKAIDILSNYL